MSISSHFCVVKKNFKAMETSQELLSKVENTNSITINQNKTRMLTMERIGIDYKRQFQKLRQNSS